MDNATISSIATLFIALANFIVIWYSNRQIKKTSDQIKSTVLLECFNKYISIRKDRTTAIRSKSKEDAEDFYREFIDLFWFEYQLWRDNLIDDDIMKAWLYTRNESYKTDQINCGEQGIVRYKDVWSSLTKNRYYAPDDEFIRFMELGHDGKVDRALKECKIKKN